MLLKQLEAATVRLSTQICAPQACGGSMVDRWGSFPALVVFHAFFMRRSITFRTQLSPL